MDNEQLHEGDLPRFAIKLQDNLTGFTMAVGANDLKAFRKTDLSDFIKTFARRTLEAERRQAAAAEQGGEA